MRSAAGASARAEYRAARARRRHRWAAIAGLVGLASVALSVAPGAATVGAAGVALIAAWLLRPRGDVGRWLRGAVGEEATARALGRLPARRWVVLTDLRIPGSRANLDHLVIGPKGVWVVDTKATRSRVRGRWGQVRFGERRLDPGPTRWEAEVAADRLGVPVRPLIAVHGRGLRRRGVVCDHVRVLPAAQVTRRLRRGRRRLGGAEVAALARLAETVFVPPGKGTARRG